MFWSWERGRTVGGELKVVKVGIMYAIWKLVKCCRDSECSIRLYVMKALPSKQNCDAIQYLFIFSLQPLWSFYISINIAALAALGGPK